jgi:hypothetical protein
VLNEENKSSIYSFLVDLGFFHRGMTNYYRATMSHMMPSYYDESLVARCILMSFQNCADLLEFFVLLSWYDAFHRSTMASAYFFSFWAFFDDFLTLASLMSDFSPLGLFA